MLVLSRYVNQKIKIGDDITIVLIGVKGDRVRIGIEAPKGVKVHREEIWTQVQELLNDDANKIDEVSDTLDE